MQAVAIASILTTWLFYALICVGLGAWFPLAVKKENRPDLLATLWIGLCTLLALLQLWHFLALINFIPHAALLLLGILGTLAILKSIPYSIINTPPYAALALLLIAIWLANRATGPNADYDAGLYHIQAVQWTETYRIIPGLANLHMRFGFSSTLTLFAAFLDQGFWSHNASHLLNGFFLAALAAMIVRSAARILKHAATDPAEWLLLFSSPLLTDWALDLQASSYSTDIGAAVLTVIAAYYFLRSFADRTISPFLCTLLAATAISAKASTLFLCLPLLIIAILLQKRLRLPSILAAAILILPWLVRQTILTGYPLYPYENLSLPVDWKMPYDKVHWLHRIILDWARWQSYDDTRGHYRWLNAWYTGRLLPGNMLWKCLIPALAGALALIFVALRRKAPRAPLILLACVFLGIIGWYTSAPDPRYASQLFILWMAIPLAMLARGKAFFALAILLACGPLFVGRALWMPSPETGLFHPTPSGHYQPITTAAGIQINVPVTPEGGFEDRVWNAPLPATPASEIDPKEVTIPPLRLRHPPDLQDGFSRPAKKE